MPRKEIKIPLANGCTLRCGPGAQTEWGGNVRICDPRGREILYWSAGEFEEDAESCIGAIFAASQASLEELKNRGRDHWSQSL